jgi:hypothetical protein
MMRMKSILVAAAVLAAASVTAKKSSIPLVYDQEFTGAKYAAPAFPSVSDAKNLETLPNPFEFENSKKQVKPAFKAAFAEGAMYVGADQLNTLVALKSKNELIADVVAALESPILDIINGLEHREEKAAEAPAAE